MTAIFKQIRFDKDTSEKEDFGIRVIISISIVGLGIYFIIADLLRPIIVAPIILVLTGLSRPLSRRYYSNWVRSNDLIGDFIFDDTTITWTNSGQLMKINYIDIESIDLKYNYIKGKKITIRDFIHNGLAQIDVLTKTGNLVTIKFIIENKEQIESLKPIWVNLYKIGIKIKEKLGQVDIKTIVFEFQSGMSYEKLKQLKNELNVNSFN